MIPMGNPQRDSIISATAARAARQTRSASLTNSRSRPQEARPVECEDTAELQSLLKSLNDALTAELVCAFLRRDNRRWYAEYGGSASSAESGARCGADLDLADRLAERIVQLGGHPEFALDVLEGHGHEESKSPRPINDRLSSDLAAERTAAALHQELMARLGTSDPATSSLLYEFLLADEVHVSSLSSLWWSCQRGQENLPIKYELSALGARKD
jgi:bacterioferritin